jgi:hypothetical protein
MPAAEAQAPTRHVAPKLKRRRKRDTAPSSSRAGVRSRRSIRPANPSHAQRCRVHRISSRVRDDRDTPLVWDETAGDIKLIWVRGEQENFCLWDSTTQITPNLARRAIGFCDGIAGRATLDQVRSSFDNGNLVTALVCQFGANCGHDRAVRLSREWG